MAALPLCDPCLGGRAFLRAEWLRSTKVLCDARRYGDQEWPPSRYATRDLGGRAFLRAEWLRSTKVLCDARRYGDQEWSPSRCATR